MTAKPTAKQIRDSVEAPTMWGTPNTTVSAPAPPQQERRVAA